MALYYNPSSSCSYYSNETNFKYIPESTLASIHSSHNCTWLESIISRNYTAQDVWRDLLPTTVYNPNFTNCYGDQYMDYFNLSIAHDHDYSYFRLFLIPRGLSSLADSCLTPACQWSGAGNPDIAGIGVSSILWRKCPPTPKGNLQRDDHFQYRCWLHTHLSSSS